MEVWLDRIRDRHIVSVQAARPVHNRQPGSTSKARARRGHQKVIGITPCWRNLRPPKQLELLERLEPFELASLMYVQSDGGTQSAGQTENSFRQSQTILRDLKHS